MNPEIKAEWVAALRSGEYRQTQGFLNRGDGSFCCLGVLCEVARKHGVIGDPVVNDQFSEEPMAYDGESLGLPFEVRQWATISETGELPLRIDDNLSHESLAAANDGGVPFEAIADIIEEYL